MGPPILLLTSCQQLSKQLAAVEEEICFLAAAVNVVHVLLPLDSLPPLPLQLALRLEGVGSEECSFYVGKLCKPLCPPSLDPPMPLLLLPCSWPSCWRPWVRKSSPLTRTRCARPSVPQISTTKALASDTLQLAKRLETMGEEDFSSHVDELCKAKLEAPKRLREAVGRVWREIDDGSLR